MNELALLGGKLVFDKPMAAFNHIGEEEQAVATEVLKSGVLSGFIGAPGPEFMGGPWVRTLEEAWCKKFGTKYAISVNSATSGLFAAIGASCIGPGDEVIVPPYSMSATVMAPLVYGGIPVFADIEPETFCLDPASVKAKITHKTKAILAVNLFGHPAQLRVLRDMADAHGLILIEDNAQAPLAVEGEAYAGTVGHIGVFSLNRHKHIQAGEGGICVTNDDDLGLRLQLIRNHGENLVEEYDIEDITNILGFNYRLTELSAAIGVCQLEKAKQIITERESYAKRLTQGISDLPGIIPPVVRPGCRHVYYVWAMRFNQEIVGLSRDIFARALCAEGFPVNQGYTRPLYLLPVFQRKRAIGANGFPFSLSTMAYERGSCPVVEQMYENVELGFNICSVELSDQLVDQCIDVVHKVYEQRSKLSKFAYSEAS